MPVSYTHLDVYKRQVGMRSEWTLSGKEAVLRARQSMEMGDVFHAYIIDLSLIHI